MDNATKIKRKAQDLAKKGSFAEAAEEYAKLGVSGSLGPYDYVVLGDYLLRAGRRSDAVEQYNRAAHAYSEGGLHRNAIALAKKVQRLDPESLAVSFQLGELYAAESMASEACLHFLEYLEKADAQGQLQQLAEDVIQACSRLLDLSLPSFEIVDRLVELAQRLHRGAEVAHGVARQAHLAGERGMADTQSRLLDLALSLDPELSVTSLGKADTAIMNSPARTPAAAPGADLEVPPAPPRARPAPSVSGVPVLSLDGLDDAQDGSGGEISLHVDDDAPSPEENAGVHVGVDAEEEEPRIFSLDPGDGHETPGVEPELPAEPSARPEPSVSRGGLSLPAGEAQEDPDAVRAQAVAFRDKNELVRAQREFMKAGRIYFAAGSSRDAAQVYEDVVALDPNHLDALRGLVEIAHINGERARMAQWGCELGDVLLAREMYPEAKFQFERVLAFDSTNQKALARLKRLNTIAGVQGVTYGTLAPTWSEVEGAKFTVLDDAPRGQTELNLAEILEEFQGAVADRIDPTDAQSHYDLGMTYKEMNLLEEAVASFCLAAEHDPKPARSLEMLFECYLLLDRMVEAHQTLDRLLAAAPGPGGVRHLVHMGKAAEAAGDWGGAERCYYRALDLDGDSEEAYACLEVLENRREQGAA